MKRLVAGLIVVASGMMACVGTDIAVAEPTASVTDSVLLVVDVSGSMADKDSGGRIKIEGAKAGVSSLLGSFPATARVGLMTYPGDGNCGAPAVVRTVQPLSQGNLGAVLTGLPAPRGNTPTSEALRKAAELIGHDQGNGTIVLVSDGESNCGDPPCVVAQEIVKSGIALTVNTVGFSIGEQGRTELQCISGATGGRYVDVADGDELGEELANQMRPVLELWASYPSGDVPVSSVGASVRAKVTNTSTVTATNVQITLVPSGAGPFLGIPRPVVSLGNLAKGETRQIDWTIPVTPQLLNERVELTMTVSGSNVRPATHLGVVVFGEGGSLIGANSQFAGVQNVALLGDSFSAGDGSHRNLSDYLDVPGSGRVCRQSRQSYAEVLFPGKVHNFACTGAETEHVSNVAQHATVAPQLDQLRAALRKGERFDLVFLTIGGNDVMFGDVAANCIITRVGGSLGKGSARLPFLNPCMVDPGSGIYGAHQELLNGQGALLEFTYGGIARVFTGEGLDAPPTIVSPYPLMFPSDPSLRWSCGTINLVVSMEQMGYFTDFQRQLNRLIEESVNKARNGSAVPVYFAAGVEYAFQPDHTMCHAASWVVPPRLSNIAVVGEPQDWDTPFHPTAAGQQAWALALARWAETPGLTLENARPRTSQSAYLLTLGPRGSIDGDAVGNTVPAGRVELRASGLMPHSPLIAIVHSHPYALGWATADADGRAVLYASLDDRLLPPGAHELHLSVVEADGAPNVRVSSLYVTRAIPYSYWALLGLGVAFVVAGALWRRKTRT